MVNTAIKYLLMGQFLELRYYWHLCLVVSLIKKHSDFSFFFSSISWKLCFLERKKSDRTPLKRLVLHFVDFLNIIRIVLENLIYIQFFDKIFILASPQKAQKTFRKCDFRSAFLNNRKRFHLLFYGRFLRAHKKLSVLFLLFPCPNIFFLGTCNFFFSRKK